MTPTPARIAALETLRATRRGELADRALFSALTAVPARDRGWTQELAYGTFRLRGRLDHLIATHVRGGLDRVDDDVLDILRLGAYQLVEMASVPPYAAVSESVELARSSGNARATGFVNGVLQSLARAPDRTDFPALENDAPGYLATWGSHPPWLVSRWIGRLGEAGAAALVAANLRRPQLYLRPVRTDVAAAVHALTAAGMQVEPVDGAPDAVRVIEGSVVEALAAGPAIVQDPAAGLVARFVDPAPGATVLDLCAAPGGKAVALADFGAHVIAADRSIERTGRLAANVRRLPPLPIDVVVADARRPAVPVADVVLLDAPCTGTGTFRRHPDGKWRVEPADLASLVALQCDLLRSAAAVTAPGGLLVYATCSLEPEENEAQVDRFLEETPEFTLEPGTAVDARWLDPLGRLRVLPHESGWDGAFAARLRRSG